MDDAPHSRPTNAQFLDTAFALLRDCRRRRVVSLLADRESRISLTELAAEVTARERTDGPDGTPPGRTDETVATLHHDHLPKLADAGAIAYDAERKVVTPTRVEELASLVRTTGADGA